MYSNQECAICPVTRSGTWEDVDVDIENALCVDNEAEASATDVGNVPSAPPGRACSASRLNGGASSWGRQSSFSSRCRWSPDAGAESPPVVEAGYGRAAAVGILAFPDDSMLSASSPTPLAPASSALLSGASVCARRASMDGISRVSLTKGQKRCSKLEEAGALTSPLLVSMHTSATRCKLRLARVAATYSRRSTSCAARRDS